MQRIKTYAEMQSKGWATKHAPPNIKKLDPPPMKKSKGPQAPPEVHIAVNIAPTPGAGGAMQGSYVVSQMPVPQMVSASVRGPSSPEQVGGFGAHAETSSTVLPPGCKILVRNAAHSLALALAKCTETGILLTTEEVLTLMDHEDPQPDGRYLDSLDDLVSFGVHNAINIHSLEVCFLATFGTLGRGGAHNLRQFTKNKIMIPLGLHLEEEKPLLSVAIIEPPECFERIQKWRTEVGQSITTEVGKPMAQIKEEDEIEEYEDEDKVDEHEIEETGSESRGIEVVEVSSS
jgi:hypothetical protein